MNTINLKSVEQSNYFEALTHFFFLIVHVDGNVSEKELLYGDKMIRHEKFSEQEFSEKMNQLYAIKNPESIYNKGLGLLRKTSKAKQVKCIAWLCLISNSDGFMDQREWVFIYDLYSKELNLTTGEIMEEQKRINKELSGTSPVSFGIKVNS